MLLSTNSCVLRLNLKEKFRDVSQKIEGTVYRNTRANYGNSFVGKSSISGFFRCSRVGNIRVRKATFPGKGFVRCKWRVSFLIRPHKGRASFCYSLYKWKACTRVLKSLLCILISAYHRANILVRWLILFTKQNSIKKENWMKPFLVNMLLLVFLLLNFFIIWLLYFTEVRQINAP